MWVYAATPSDPYISHYGVKGMRWGIQKARNQKLASDGKGRLSISERKAIAKKYRDDNATAKELGAKAATANKALALERRISKTGYGKKYERKYPDVKKEVRARLRKMEADALASARTHEAGLKTYYGDEHVKGIKTKLDRKGNLVVKEKELGKRASKRSRNRGGTPSAEELYNRVVLEVERDLGYRRYNE